MPLLKSLCITKSLSVLVASQFGVKIKCYHSDNHVFNSTEFASELQRFDQTIDFRGVSAHHQNGMAKHAICTVTEWACDTLMHAALHWPEHANNLHLWLFALDYAAHLWNEMPKCDLHVTPNEIFGKTQSTYKCIRHARVFGCPVYVLDPKLQDRNKLPKWQPQSCHSVFLGFSREYSSSIGLILNPQTGYVSPQFHVVYDDLFRRFPILFPSLFGTICFAMNVSNGSSFALGLA
jgi:hypothetical protein